jgi:hypothetical protein
MIHFLTQRHHLEHKDTADDLQVDHLVRASDSIGPLFRVRTMVPTRVGVRKRLTRLVKSVTPASIMTGVVQPGVLLPQYPFSSVSALPR